MSRTASRDSALRCPRLPPCCVRLRDECAAVPRLPARSGGRSSRPARARVTRRRDRAHDRFPSRVETLADGVHADQQDERDRRQHQAGGVGPFGVEALDAVVDVEGGRLGLADHVAGDDEHRAELAQRAGDGQRDAVGDAPADRGQGDAPEGPPAAGPQRVGRLLAARRRARGAPARARGPRRAR